MTNVSGRGRVVKPLATSPGPEILEISRLLVELIQSGSVSQRSGADPETSGSGGHATAGDGSVAGMPPAAGPTAGPASAHVIRAAIHIHDEGPLTIGQLAQGLGISQGWASRVVDELERAGYVERERDPADRRVVRVRLTPVAAERVERVSQWRGGAVEAALAGMGPGERDAVAVFLRRFLASVRATGA